MRIWGKGFVFVALLLLPGMLRAQTVGPDAVLAEGTRISLQLNDYLSTKLNNEGDPFTATVTAPVYFRDRIVIPKGSILSGSISRIIRPGRFKGKAVMNLLFSSIRLPGATEPILIVASLARLDPEGNAGVQSEGTITGDGSKGKDVVKIVAPAATGAGIGGIVGGGRGAAIGVGVGAAIGLGRVLAEKGKDLEIKRGSTMDIVLDRPLTVPVEIVKRLD